MDKQYNPKETEAKIYKLWEESGFFDPDKLPPSNGRERKDPFCIIMPPPNANGSLHLGHAVFVTLEDLMIRFWRLRGKAALWLPGADHAGFETQVVFEKKLEKEGRNRFEIPREQLYQETLEFTLANKKAMEDQLRELGASCDWSREKFTLDPDIIKIVYDNFRKLYDDGLAYRDVRPVNWCTKHQTSLSDLEVKYEERKDPLYYMKYGPLTLATVRLETKFGDTAVAVNPRDERYQKYVGQTIDIETVIGPAKIKVIADEHVDPAFGTGVVKITPAHDPDDFEVGQRHGLEVKEVIDQYGKLNEKAGPYAGMKVLEARAKIAEDMQKKGLIEKIDENYTHTVGHCYKCGTILEPRILPQWFIAVNKAGTQSGKTLAKDAVAAVKKGQVKFASESFEKIFYHWMANIRDWNISRQIVWGIRIPAWYCTDCQEVMVSPDSPPTECLKCHSENIKQDSDVFDTWFSSGQWPFATLKASRTGDFEKYYPTSVMETGWDILFFWVARMIMLGLYFTDKVPFSDVVLHGLVRDKDKQKMSKSKGNAVDPLGVVSEYGADALRMALVFGASMGTDISFREDKIVAHKKFANKIWNAARFALQSLGQDFDPAKIKPEYSDSDTWILGELKKSAAKITQDIKKFEFHEAAQEIYHFFWHSFCDKCIEDVKNRIKEPVSEIDKATAQLVLWRVLIDSLKLLHPFMPFLTEAIYQEMPHHSQKALIVEEWPEG